MMSLPSQSWNRLCVFSIAVLESSIESEDRKKSKPLDNNKDTPAETESYAPKSLE